MSKMIPLHIADRAVAACNDEIHKLQEENAELKAYVETVKKRWPGLYQEAELAGKTYEVVRIGAKPDTEEGKPCIRVTLTLMDKEPKPHA